MATRSNTFNYKELFEFGPLVMMSVALVAMLGVGIAIVPLTLNAFDMNLKIERLEKEFANVSDKVTKLEGYRGVDYESRLNDSLLRALPEKLDVPYVIDSLRTLADEYELDVQLASSKSSASVDDSKLVTQVIEMNVTGEREKWEGFVENLHNLAPIVRLDTVQIRFKTNEDGSGEGNDVIDSTMTFKTSALVVPELALEEIKDKEIPQLDANDDVLYEKLRGLRSIEPEDFVGQEGSVDRNPFESE